VRWLVEVVAWPWKARERGRCEMTEATGDPWDMLHWNWTFLVAVTAAGRESERSLVTTLRPWQH
jgi:hypothetical protein